jgi:hypothetical protein
MEVGSVGGSVGDVLPAFEEHPVLPTQLEKLKSVTLRNAFSIYYLNQD